MDTAPNLPPHAHALLVLMRTHLRHLDRDEGVPLSTPQWTAAIESPRTVAAVKSPGQELTEQDVPMIVGTGAPGRRRHLYSTMPVPPGLAERADESEVALFQYNRRGRIQPANRTAAARQAKPWYLPARAMSPMRLIEDEHWEAVAAATGEDTRPEFMTAVGGWTVLLLATAVLCGALYTAAQYFSLF